jgi:hypothetical protein
VHAGTQIGADAGVKVVGVALAIEALDAASELATLHLDPKLLHGA